MIRVRTMEEAATAGIRLRAWGLAQAPSRVEVYREGGVEVTVPADAEARRVHFGMSCLRLSVTSAESLRNELAAVLAAEVV